MACYSDWRNENGCWLTGRQHSATMARRSTHLPRVKNSDVSYTVLRPLRHGERSLTVPRIPYPDLSTITDPEILGYLEDARLYGAPRPESQAIRTHVPAVIRAFSQAWETT